MKINNFKKTKHFKIYHMKIKRINKLKDINLFIIKKITINNKNQVLKIKIKSENKKKI